MQTFEYIDLITGEKKTIREKNSKRKKITIVQCSYHKAIGYKQCRNCKHATLKRFQHSMLRLKSIDKWKCSLISDDIGSASDIKLDYVCDLWRQK